MSPGGHLVTTAIAGGVALAATGSVPLTVGGVVGGFLIDVDHAVDYVTVERRREITPAAFLRYYTAGRARRVVLALHSYEVFLALAVLAWWLDATWLAGYLAGGAMHLALDIVVNGRQTPKNIFAFYSFGFRLAHGFDAEALLGSEPLIVPVGFWRSFFLGARLARPRVGRRAAASLATRGQFGRAARHLRRSQDVRQSPHPSRPTGGTNERRATALRPRASRVRAAPPRSRI